MYRNQLTSFLLSLSLGVVLLSSSFVAAQRNDDVPADVSCPFSPIPARAGGNFHLFYELHITNLRGPALMLRRVEVYGDRGDASVASYTNAEIASRRWRPGIVGDADKRLIAGGMTAVMFLEVIVANEREVPRMLRHRFLFSVGEKESVLDDVRVNVQTVGPIVIEPPLRGNGWVALSAVSNTNSHRRTVVVVNGKARIAQRFATDWTRIGADGLAFRGDPSKNSNWSAYGANVYAVARGVVSLVKDGIPENDTTSDNKAVTIDLSTVAGNHIILDLGRGHYALYAHLQPGSIRVKVGEKVHPGQVIALLGNSGQADAPHLHFQIMDANSPLGAEGLPYHLRSFYLLGTLPSKQLLVSGGWRPQKGEVLTRLETPFENAVIRFP